MNNNVITKISKVLLIVFLLQFTVPVIAETVELTNGTRLQLSLFQTLKGDNVTIGQRVTFKLQHDVKVDGKVVIPSGADAIGEVIDAEGPGMIGKPGNLTVQVKSIQAVDGTSVPLSASKVVKGQDKATTSIILTLLCIIGLFMEGGDATMQQGTIIEAYTIGDVDIEL